MEDGDIIIDYSCEDSALANHIIEQLILQLFAFPFAVKDSRWFYSGVPKNFVFNNLVCR